MKDFNYDQFGYLNLEIDRIYNIINIFLDL